MKPRIAATMTLFCVALLLAGSGPSPAAAGFPYVCSDATLRGTYGAELTGTVSPDGVNQVSLTEVGVFRCDGAGNVTGEDTVSFGGQVIERELVGTYSVTQDCRAVFVLSIVGVNGPPFTLSGVVIDGGNSSLMMGTSPGTSISGHSHRVAPSF